MSENPYIFHEYDHEQDLTDKDLCSGCNEYRHYDDPENQAPDNCVTWLCGSLECPLVLSKGKK